jgi:ATP-dependent RNA helicase DDX51/DBP6
VDITRTSTAVNQLDLETFHSLKTPKVKTNGEETKVEDAEAGENGVASRRDSKTLKHKISSSSKVHHEHEKDELPPKTKRHNFKGHGEDGVKGDELGTPGASLRLVDSSGNTTLDAPLGKHKTVLSKFESSKKAANQATKKQLDQTLGGPSEEQYEKDPFNQLQGLHPLPQPEPSTKATISLGYYVLPQWLAKPITASSKVSTPLDDYDIDEKLLSHLKSKGFIKTFAVQAAVIPMLLPGPTYHEGDICIAAPTGSGKTLAYVLPMVERLRRGISGRLRGLIIVPTRELVAQIREVCELCAVGSGLKVGTAVGSRALKTEQSILVSTDQVWSPEGYSHAQKKRSSEGKDWDANLTELFQDLEELSDPLPYHIIEHQSNLDILICTPGRLVEHVRSTRGFSLKDVQYLVVDEADRLLDESFQHWVEVVMKSIYFEKPCTEMSSNETLYLKWSGSRKSKVVKKVILSATMTKDLQKLKGLKLRRPRLVVLEGSEGVKQISDGQRTDQEQPLSLPPTLVEWAIPVGDGSDKPRYLLYLIEKHLLLIPKEVPHSSSPSISSDSDRAEGDISSSSSLSKASGSDEVEQDTSSDLLTTSSEDHTSSDASEPDQKEDDVSSDPSSTSYDEDTSSQSSSDTSSVRNASRGHVKQDSTDIYPSPKHEKVHGILIFTSSNAAALRLTRLLSILKPDSGTQIATITSTLRSSQRRKTMTRFRNHSISIIVASDLVARGLDIPDLAHVVNYDIPSSLHGYIHRVGRTARAGKKGQAWTLVTEKEAGWFWRRIARGENVERTRKIQRLNVKLGDDGILAYENALSKLGEEVKP